jgi:glycosyltransferase involved in cell wall biosynthesis
MGSAPRYAARRLPAAAQELSVVMPVFNERTTVGAAVDELLGAELGVDGVELVLVDDGSTDGTRELLRNSNWPESVHVHLRDRNGGKRAAVRTGLGRASGRYATVLDADLEYRAEAIRDLLAPVAAREADAAFGIGGFRAHSDYSFWYVAGNRSVALTASLN